MDFLIAIFPMLLDQYRAMNQPVPKEVPGFSTSAQVYKGMPIAAAVQQLGMPKDVEDNYWGGGKMLVYRGEMCSMKGENCYIHTDEHGLVKTLARIKPQYMKGL